MTRQLPIPKEKLQKIIEIADEIITVNNGTNDDIWENDTATITALYDSLNDDLAPPSVVKAMARALLAAHEQEPVAWSAKDVRNGAVFLFASTGDTTTALSENQWLEITPLYTHPATVPAVPDEPWRIEAEKQAEIYGQSFVVFRNGEQPQCADPTKVVISFTDKGLGHNATHDGAKKALSDAVAAIYFTDSSDYLSALFAVVKALSPETLELLLANDKAAYDATRHTGGLYER